MSPAQHVRASTELGRIGLLACAFTVAATVIACAVLDGAHAPKFIAEHPAAFGFLSFGLVVVAALLVACDGSAPMECDEMRDAFNHDAPQWPDDDAERWAKWHSPEGTR